MSWAAIGSAVVGGVASYAINERNQGNEDGTGGGNLEYKDPYSDEYFSKSQELLSQLGEDFVGGNIPEYYQGIGDANSPEVTKARSLYSSEIQRKGEELAASRGLGSSPAGMAPTMEALNKGLTEWDMNTLIKSLEGKKYLLNTGINALGTTGSQALSATGKENQFNMDQYKTEYQDPVNPYKNQAGAIGDIVGLFNNGNKNGDVDPQVRGSAYNPNTNTNPGWYDQVDLSSLNSSFI